MLELPAMTSIPDGEFLLPIFPLPDLVFFPNTRLPLHIFQPRYRHDQMPVREIETVGLEPLTNALIMSLNLDSEEKQKLLETDDVVERAEQIGNELTSRIETMRFLKPYRRGEDPNQN